MRLAEWARRLADFQPAQHILESLDSSSEWQSIAPEARPVLLAAAYKKKVRKVMILTSSYDRCLAWQAKLTLCGVPDYAIKQLSSGTSALFEDASPEHIALSDRIGALKALVQDRPSIIIATAAAALERTLPRDILLDAFIDLKPGEDVDPDRLIQQLVNLGYEPQEPVRIPGQFSRRGGIIDIYASGRDLPVRVELFGDEVESIREFDPNTQRSVGNVESLSLAPSRETLYTSGESDYRDLIMDTMEREVAHLGAEEAARLEELVTADAESLSQSIYFDRLDLYRPLLHPDSGCAIDLLEDDALLILDEPLELEAIVARHEEELAQSLQARARRGEILHSPANDFMLPPEHMANHGKTVTMSAMNALPDWLTPGAKVDVNASSLEPYRGRSEAFTHTLKNWLKAGFGVVFATDQPTRAKSVLSQAEIFASDEWGGAGPRDQGPGTGDPSGVNLFSATGLEPESGKLKKKRLKTQDTKHSYTGSFMVTGNLAGGFVMPDLMLAVVSDAELFGVGRLRLPQKRFMEGAPIATVLDLKPGDFVVHIHFGIGIFRGLAKRIIEDVEKEFLYIEYQAPDKLFVPTDQLDRIQKYLNPGDSEPKLNRLTGGEWQRTISRAREDARAFAGDLVKLYAQRKTVRRRPFGADSPWQAEMEATFPWVETPSQLIAIKEAKRDLQQDFPMDRLICGDVGFGKTEVAIRAAFKVAQAERQVAVLCPTTILSEQHHRNFLDRLSSFPVNVALLNRFRSAAEKRDIIAEIKSGKVDIVIGTHALLAKDVEFKDLGLVVVDEEQKFGVKQKEMLKKLRTAVDVLTLSATPIPRTLSMALMDIRQMSLINDPPPGRLPIRTFLRPFSQEVAREAILREMSRGGQVFYVYNRVEGIMHVAEKLRRLVPTARIGVGHGQMTEQELEPVMLGFIKGEIDILLSTTIIENGIDIPNANTLIVENSDRLGLSQLYQLRGRVGRSDRQAYAYLLYQTGKELTPNAMARLQALQEFSSLGSGYSLAFRDLQIRGAGELLGAKQHGAMAAVGYELFTQLINEQVQLLKNSVDGTLPSGIAEPKDPLESLSPLPTLELPVVALIPDSYIRDQAQRLFYYQKMMSARDQSGLSEVSAEIEDRYGHPSDEVKAAFRVMQCRMKMRDLGIEKMDGKGGRLAAVFRDRTATAPRVFSILSKKNRECYLTRDNFIWPFHEDPLNAAERMLSLLGKAVAEVEEERLALGV
jgi:transcription-repair coupling factor (superfamily II helicase)